MAVESYVRRVPAGRASLPNGHRSVAPPRKSMAIGGAERVTGVTGGLSAGRAAAVARKASRKG